jgi:hypothetical protein
MFRRDTRRTSAIFTLISLALASGCAGEDDLYESVESLTTITPPGGYARLIGQASGELPPVEMIQAFEVTEGIPSDVLEDVASVRAGDPLMDASPVTATDTAVEASRLLAPSTPLRIVVALPDVGAEFGRLQSAPDLERAILISERQESIRAEQDAVEARLASRGATGITRFWIANSLAATVPAGYVAEIATWPEISEVYLDGTEGGGGLAYSGVEGRNGMLTPAFHSSGYKGETRGRAGGVQLLAIIEWHDEGCVPAGTTCNWLARTHVGWDDFVSGPRRIRNVYDCRSGTCSASRANATTDTHGTHAAWAALGSIEQGQDPGFAGSNTTEQTRRSAQAPEAEFYYYVIDGCSELSAAIQHAVSLGVDVANYSGWVDSQTCGPASRNCGGINDAIRNATDAGLLFAACGGNSGHASGCTLWYPGWRTDALAVTHLDTTDASTSYGETTLYSNASRGGMPIRTWLNQGIVNPALGLVAPGEWSYNFTTAPSGYNTSGFIWGCSFAAPAVAGAAALMREALNAAGHPANNARALMTNLFLLGDGWDFDAGSQTSIYVSDASGYGRVRLHRPYALQSPWGWGTTWFTIQNGQTVSWTVGDANAESALVSQWKWAFTWFESNLDGVADIVISVVDTCPAGGGEALVLRDYSTSLRKRIRLSQSLISGKCLTMRAYGLSVPTGGRVVYSADYFHAGDPSTH